MEEEFSISRDGTRLTFLRPAHCRDSDLAFVQYICALETPGLNATVKVFDRLPSAISRLFDDMAQSWRGWPGQLQGGSLEGHLELQAESDPLGHIALCIVLRSDSVGGFVVQASLGLDSGDLENLAKRARDFFDA